MVALSKSDIPDSVNTVEKLAVWCSTILQNLSPTATIVESTAEAALQATSSPFFVTAGQTPQWVHISRLSLKLSADWQKNRGIWNYAQDISSTAIPTEFKS